MMSAGAINAWECPACRKYTIAVHVDNGVTPMFLACRANIDVQSCVGQAVSLGYPVKMYFFPHEVHWEWYRPDDSELQSLDESGRVHTEGTRAHVEQGGLLIRRITPAGKALIKRDPILFGKKNTR